MSHVDWSHLPRRDLLLRRPGTAGILMGYAAGTILLILIGTVAIVVHDTADPAANGIDLVGP